MNLVGTMIWYDESPSWLSSCVSGFARICDTIVAVDGAYQMYPGSRPRSPGEQADAIQDACEAAGVGCVIHRPKDIWFGNEVAKRQHAIRLAGSLNPDWVLVFDADYLVMLIDDAALTRSLIEGSDKNVITYTLFDSMDVLKDDAFMCQYAQEHTIDHEWTTRDRGIFRWTDDLTYGPAHFCVRGTYDGEMEWLRGPDLSASDSTLAAPVDHLGRNLVVSHRNKERSMIRTKAAAAYYALRDETGVEKIDHSSLYGVVVA